MCKTAISHPGAWPRWRFVALCFCVFSVVGHWMEIGYCQLVRLRIVPGVYDPASPILDDWLFPYCVYGFGAAVCVLALAPAKAFLQQTLRSRVASLAASFALNTVVCAVIEFAMGLAFNQPLPSGALPLWDYRAMPCNFLGQVCLQNVVAFGLVATFMTWVVCPWLETRFDRVPNRVMNFAFSAVTLGFTVLIAKGS